MGKFLFSDTPCGNMGNGAAAVVPGIVISGIDYGFGLVQHPVFVFLVEDSPSTAKAHNLGSGHERENESFENNTIKSCQRTLDQT